MTKRRMRTHIYIGILLIMAIFACCVIPKGGISKNDDKDKEITEVNDFSQTQPTNVRSLYDEIHDLSIDDAIDVLNREAERVRSLIPDFPDFPSIWLVPPKEKGTYGSIGERHSVSFLQLLFPGHRFIKVRPKWLRNPDTNRCLELDGYCDELRLAVEYNGVQHYEWPNFLGISFEDFIKQRKRDKIKEDVCRKENICLIRVPYTVPVERIPLAVFAKLLDSVPSA